MVRAAVPVAAIDENGDLRRAEDDIRRAAQVRQWASGHAISEAPSVEKLTDHTLRLGVA